MFAAGGCWAGHDACYENSSWNDVFRSTTRSNRFKPTKELAARARESHSGRSQERLSAVTGGFYSEEEIVWVIQHHFLRNLKGSRGGWGPGLLSSAWMLKKQPLLLAGWVFLNFKVAPSFSWLQYKKVCCLEPQEAEVSGTAPIRHTKQL
jgi:hypothetical protein